MLTPELPPRVEAQQYFAQSTAQPHRDFAQSTAQPHRAGTAILLWLAFSGLVASSLIIAGLSTTTLLLAGILLALFAPLWHRTYLGRLDILETVVFATIAFLVMFVGRPLYMLKSDSIWHLGYDTRPTFDAALLLALAGVLSFQIGYFSRIGWVAARRFPIPKPPSEPRLLALAITYLLVGLGLFTAFLTTQGGLGTLASLLQGRSFSNNRTYLTSTGYLYNGPLLLSASALLFTLLYLVYGRKQYRAAALVVGGAFSLYYLQTGTRSNLIVLALGLPVLYYLHRLRRPRPATLILVCFLALLLLSGIREARTAGDDQGLLEQTIAAASAPDEAFLSLLGGSDAEMFDTLANAAAAVPDRLPFQHGATITDLVIRAVPRPLWPDKPLESNDAFIATLWPDHYAASRAAPASSIIGALYIDSGLPTVILGMFAIGVASNALWSWRSRHRTSPIAQLLYAATLPFIIVLLRGTFPDTLSRILFVVVPLIPLVSLRRRGTADGPSRVES